MRRREQRGKDAMVATMSSEALSVESDQKDVQVGLSR